MNIYFFNEDAQPPAFLKKTVREIAKKIALEEQKNIKSVNIIFCSDNYLLAINKEYLNHDYFTDIITFNYNEDKTLSGDLFISVDTVKTNAQEYGVTFDMELYRVMIHGVLHLIGFDDISDELQQEMTQKEDEALNILYANFL